MNKTTVSPPTRPEAVENISTGCRRQRVSKWPKARSVKNSMRERRRLGAYAVQHQHVARGSPCGNNGAAAMVQALLSDTDRRSSSIMALQEQRRKSKAGRDTRNTLQLAAWLCRSTSFREAPSARSKLLKTGETLEIGSSARSAEYIVGLLRAWYWRSCDEGKRSGKRIVDKDHPRSFPLAMDFRHRRRHQ